MKIDINYEQDRCGIVVSPDSVLTEVAFSVEAAASHFFGRGVYRFECVRSKAHDGTCSLAFKALMPSGPMVISKVMNVGIAAQQGYFPLRLKPDQDFKLEDKAPFQKLASEGQHRHGSFMGRTDKLFGFRDGGLTTTIIESIDMDPSAPLAVVTYGLGDLFTGLFALGVQYIKWQGSIKHQQLYFKHNLTDKQIADYFASRVDYDIRRKVATL